MRSERDDGQMMLLAAVVLVVAFLSLSVLVSRISVIEPETARDAGNPLLREADALQRSICAIFNAGLNPAGNGNGTEQLADLFEDYSARGFYTYSRPGSPPTLTDVHVEIQDGRSKLGFVVHHVDASDSDCR